MGVVSQNMVLAPLTAIVEVGGAKSDDALGEDREQAWCGLGYVQVVTGVLEPGPERRADDKAVGDSLEDSAAGVAASD